MKLNFVFYALLAGAMSAMLASCGSNDSIKQAANESIELYEQQGIENMDNDALFVAEAGSASLLQIELGTIALDRGLSPEVKELAQELVRGHRNIQSELQEIAGRTNLVLPTTMGVAHQSTHDQVTSRSGIAFDVAYAREMADVQNQLVKRFDDMAQHGVDMDVKMFASKQVPLLRQHLQMAEKIKESIE